jgi:hypothetical protein
MKIFTDLYRWYQNWLKKAKGPYNEDRMLQAKHRYMKQTFRLLFPNNWLGYDEDRVSPIELPIKGLPDFYKLGITDIKIIFEGMFMDIAVYQYHITLERPGMLIGRQGSTYDTVLNALRALYPDMIIKIHIEESKIWN